MKKKQQIFGSVVFVLLFCAGVSADTLSIDYATRNRLGASGANIGVTSTQIVPNNNWAAFVAAENAEYRGVVGYDVRPEILGITSDQIVSATLNWTSSAWGTGRNGVNVDQVDTNLNPDVSAMYSGTLATVYENGFILNSGGVAADITDILKAAMDTATETKGISFRWYNNNTESPVPFNEGTSTVELSTGFTAGGMTLEVEYAVPEPATMCLVLIGGIAIAHRRKHK